MIRAHPCQVGHHWQHGLARECRQVVCMTCTSRPTGVECGPEASRGPTVGVDTHLSASGPSACCLKTTQAVGIPGCAILYDKNQKNSRTIRVINNNKGTMNMKKKITAKLLLLAGKHTYTLQCCQTYSVKEIYCTCILIQCVSWYGIMDITLK